MDNVNHPSHYTSGKVECIDAIDSAVQDLSGFEGYCTGNTIKYMWRWKKKNGVEDLKKARWYLDRLIGSEGKAREQCVTCKYTENTNTGDVICVCNKSVYCADYVRPGNSCEQWEGIP